MRLPERDSWPQLSLRRAPRLLRGVVRGRQYAYNPDGYDALALLSPRAAQLVDLADGRDAGSLVAELAGEREASGWLEELPLLWRNGFVRTPDVVAAHPTQPPERVFNAWLHLTNACNLACPYCYIHKSKDHMSAHVVERVLAAVQATAASGDVERIHVRYAGGEPMLRFEVMQAFHVQAVRLCSEHGVRFSAAVLTNGAVVPKGALQWLRDNNVSVSVSMDGLAELQDTMRPLVGGGSSYQRVLSGLSAYLGAGIVPYMLVTIGESNLAGVPALTEFLLARGLSFRYSLVRDLQWGQGGLDDRSGAADPQQAGRAVPTLLDGPALQQVQAVFGQCYDTIEAHVGQAGPAKRRSAFRREHRFCDLSLWQPIRQACGAGRSYVAIAESGEVSPCQAALHRTGTTPLRAQSLLVQAASQTQLPDFVRSVGNPECQRCRFKPSCAGGCPLLLHRREGHVDGRSPYCEVFRAVIPRIVRIAALELVQQTIASRLAPAAPVA